MITKLALRIIIIAVCILSSTLTRADVGGPVPNEKKILAWAVNIVGTSLLKERIAEMEKAPIDGLIISVNPDRGEHNNYQWGAGVESLRFTRDDYSNAIADLKATEFKRFTDNFLCFQIIGDSRYGRESFGRGEDYPDWFDERWSVISHNAGIAAYVAKEGGLKGLFLDMEEYPWPTGPWRKPFNYLARPDKSQRSFAQCSAKVRERGREFIQAITSAFPDITIILYGGYGGFVARAQGIQSLEKHPEPLNLAFLDGLLEGAGPKVTFVDSGNIYEAINYQEFIERRQQVLQGALKFTQVPEIYKKRVGVAFGIWTDHDSESVDFDVTDFAKNYRTPESFEHTLYSALTASDKYVWLFNGAMHPWYSKQAMATGHQKNAQPMPEAYVEALRNSRNPHDLKKDFRPGGVWGLKEAITQRVTNTQSKGTQVKNLLKNGGFEIWSAETGLPADWAKVGPGMKECSPEENVLKGGKYAVKLSNLPNHDAILNQVIDAGPYAGKTVSLGAWMKISKPSSASVLILDYDGQEHRLTANSHPGDGSWQFVVTVKTIRTNATQINFRVAVGADPESLTAYFDEAIAMVVEESD